MNSKRRAALRQQAEFRAASASKREAGIGYARASSFDPENRSSDDHRDLTGQLMGDPPPVDNRRAAWAPHLAGEA